MFTLLLLAGLSSGAGAQTEQVLIGNIDQSAGAAWASIDSEQRAQAFTTGGNAGGYTLTSVEVAYWAASSAAQSRLSVTVRSANNSGQPGTSLGTLSTPTVPNGGQHVLEHEATGSGIQLAADTTYFVVWPAVGNGMGVTRVTSAAEDAGGADGWSIADESRFGNSWSNWAGGSLQIRINGKVNATSGVTVSETSLALTELGASNDAEKTYTVVLDTDPTADVTVTVAGADATAIAVDTDTSTDGNQNTLTFTAGGDGSGAGVGNGNWAVAQTVTVRALNDADAANESFNLTHTATAASGLYNGIPINSVTVTTTDAGHGVAVSEARLSIGENDATATYMVVLKSRPSGNVVVSATSGAAATATVMPPTLTFTDTDWNTPHRVTVTGKGPGSTSISHAVSSSADTTNYPTTTTIPSVMVTVTTVPRLSLNPIQINAGDLNGATITLTPKNLSFLNVGTGGGGGSQTGDSEEDDPQLLTGTNTSGERTFTSAGLALITLAGAPTGLTISSGKVLARQSNVDGFPRHRSAEITLSYSGTAIAADDVVTVTVNQALLRRYHGGEAQPVLPAHTSLSANFRIKTAAPTLSLSPTAIKSSALNGATITLTPDKLSFLDVGKGEGGGSGGDNARYLTGARTDSERAFSSVGLALITLAGAPTGLSVSSGKVLARQSNVDGFPQHRSAEITLSYNGAAITADDSVAVTVDPELLRGYDTNQGKPATYTGASLSANFTIKPATAGLTVSPTSLVLTEQGAPNELQKTYRVRLDTDPGADVTVTATVPPANRSHVQVKAGSAAFGSTATLTFTAGGDGSGAGAGNGNWAVAQAVTVRALNDEDTANVPSFNINHAATAVGNTAPYHRIRIDPVAVTVTDAGHGVFVSRTSLAVFDGDDTQTYQVALNTPPSGNVVIETSSGDTSKATVSPPTMTFTTANWNRPRTVTVTGKGAGTARVSHTVQSSADSTNYPTSTTIPPVDVTVTADDRPYVFFSSPNYGGFEGKDVVLTVTLSEAASVDVTVPVTVDSSGRTTASSDDYTLPDPSSVTIPAGERSGTYTIAITADSENEHHELLNLLIEAANLPRTVRLAPGTRGSAISTLVNIGNVDLVTISTARLSLMELGVPSQIEKTYTIVLATDPGADVTVTVTNGDPTAIAVDTDTGTDGNQNTLTFTAGGDGSGSGNGNWAVAQTVTVRALNDGDTAGETFNITHSATATGDTAPYHGITIDPVAVDITDTGHGVVVSKSSLPIAENDDTATYTVVLESQPTGNVVISATSSDTANAEVDTDPGMAGNQSTLTFTNADWNTLQPVTVTRKGAGSATISHAVTAATVDTTSYPTSTTISTVTVTADTRPTVSLSPPWIISNEGENAEFTLTLSAALGADVTIPMTVTGLGSTTAGDDFTVPDPSSATIAAGETEATFSIAITDDDVIDKRELFRVAIDTDELPKSVRAGTVTRGDVVIEDNDVGVLVSMSAANASVREGESLEVFFELAEALDKDVRIPIVVFGNAADITDPVPADMVVDYTVTIAEGGTTGSVTLTTLQDTLVEGEESGFFVDLPTSDGLALLWSQGIEVDANADRTVVTILDDDLVVLTESSGSTAVNEDGTTDGYEVGLRELHTGRYSPSTVVATAGDGVRVSPAGNTPAASRSMNLSNLTRSEAVHVHAVDDDVDNPGGSRVGRIVHAVNRTSDGVRNAVVDDILVSIIDDDPTTVTLAAAAGGIDEGQTKEFTIALGRGLVDGETLTAPLTFTGTATRGTDYTMTGVSATGVQYNNLDSGSASVVFAGPQSGATATTATITLRATPDSAAESPPETVDIAFGTITNTGLTGAGGVDETDSLAAFTISDPAARGLVITETDGDTTVSEDGTATDTYTVALVSRPTDSVVVTVVAGAGAKVDTNATSPGDQSTLLFTTANWETAQTVTVAGVDDGADNAGSVREVDIRHWTSSDDDSYDITRAGALSARVLDDDPTAVAIAGGGTVAEDGSDSAYITVTLGRALVAGERLRVPLAIGGGATPDVDYTLGFVQGAASTVVSMVFGPGPGDAAVVFTGSDTVTARSATLAVKASDDRVDEGASERMTVAPGAVVSNLDLADPSGAGPGGTSASGSAAVAITDDDEAGVTVSASALSLTAGARHSYTLRLESRPLGTVAITPTSDDPDVAVVEGTEASSSGRVFFNADNWSSPRTVTVVGAGAGTAEVSHAVTTEAGGGYAKALPIDPVPVTVTAAASPVLNMSLTEKDSFRRVTSLDEGGVMTWRLWLRDVSSERVEVDSASLLAVTGDGVTASDYLLTDLPETLVFNSLNNYALSVRVLIRPDAEDEPNERLTFGFGTGFPDTLTRGATGTMTVVDRNRTVAELARADGGTGVVQLTEAGGETVRLTVTLSRALSGSETLTVPIGVSGTGIDAGDYTLVLASGNGLNAGVALNTGNPYSSAQPAVVFSGGAQVATLELTGLDDGTAEPSRELIEVSPGEPRGNLDEANPATRSTRGATARGVVLAEILDRRDKDDDDGATPAVKVGPPDVLAVEGGADGLYYVWLATDPEGTATVDIAPRSAGVVSVTPARLTFTPDGATAYDQPQAVTVRATPDADTADATVVLDHTVSGYGSVTGAPSVTVSIRDAGAGVVIEAANPLVAAEAGSAGYRVRLLSRPSASVTVAPRLSDSGQVAEVAGAVNFAPNEWNTAKTITVTGLSPGAAHITHAASSGDSAYAALNLPAVSVRVDASRAVADATFTIAADQPNVAAGAGAWFTVGVSPALSGPVSVSVAISGDGVAKGQFATRRARVPAGGGGQVRVSTAPGGGTVTATLPARYDGASASVTVVSPVTVTETAGGTAVAEGGATDSYTVALRTRPEVNVTVTASAGDGLLVRTAADATPAASKTLTFTPANWSEAQAVTVSAADDDIDQPGAARTSAVTHDSSSGQAAFDNLTIAPVEVAITDDDATVVSLAADADAVVGEQQDWDRGSFTVTLARALVSGEALDVPLALVSSSVALPGSASPMIRLSLPHAKGVSLIDAATAAPKVRFTGGVGVAREARVEVIPTRTGDDDSDDDAFTVRLGTLGATSGTGLDGGAAADGSANEAAMTLADDDLFVTVADAAADEGDPVEFTVTLPRPAPAGGVTVTYATRDGTLRQSDDDDDTPVRRRAVAGADYVRANGATITIAEGGRTGAISVRTVQDSISETDHHFTVLVTATSHFGLRGGLASATGVIRDDADVPAYQFRAATATVDEGATLDAVIERTGDVTTEVLVSLDHAVTGGGAVAGEDFTGGAGTVLFRAGDDEKTVRIPITDDAVNDVGETFTLALSVNDGSVGPATIGTNAGMTVTITDRDPVTVGVTAGADIREGAEAVFTLTSDTEPQNALAVSVGLTQAGGYFASDAPTSLEVTLPAGETSVEFKVATIANAYSVDADGWVGAEVVGGDGYVAAPRPRAGARVSVEDVEHVVGVGADAEEITEGGNAEFTLSVDPAPVADLVVSFDVAQTGDYVASSNLGRKSVTLAKGDTTAAYSVATVNDSATEDAGAVTLSLVAGSGYGVDEGAEDASVTVADDDHPDPEVRIEPVAGEVDEGSAAEFTVRLLGTQSAAVTVSVEVVGTTGYVAAGETGTRQVTVPTSGSATLSVPTAAVVGDTPDGEVTVTANAGSGYRLTGATVPGTVRVADTVATVVSVSGGGTLTEGDPSRTATAVVELSRVLVVGEKVLVPLRFRTAARDFLSGRKSRRDVLVSGSGQGVTLKDPDTQVRSPPNQGNYAVEFSGAGAQRATLTLSARAERSPNDRVDAVVALSLRPLNNDPVTNVGGGLEADSANKGATFTVLDREKAAAAAGVTVSPASLALTELGAANEAEKTYMVALGTDPVADVTITVTNGDATAVEVDTDSGTDGNQDTLTFTAGGDGSGSGAGNGDWAVAQAVTVRALNDADGANESFDITHGATATGDTAPYHGITIAPVAVTTTDAGHGVVVSESALSVAENDGTATYTVVLKSQPSGNVVISATSGAVANATVSPGTLTFTSGDWNRPREVTVTGKGEGSATVSHAVDSSADAASYPTTTSIPDVTVTITDDDGAGLTITETDGSTSVTEASGAGNTDTYTVALRTEPTHDVTVTVTAGTGVQINKTGGTAGTSQTLTFTSGNWSTAQTVTVTGVNDNADNPGGGRDATISHAASSTDANYTIASAGSVGARVTDDDPTTVTLSAAAGNIEEGQTKEFTIALGRGLVDGETLAVPLTFGGTASRGTDYTMTGAAAAGVRYGNLDSGNANVVFTGPESGATATTATITLSATSDSTAESTPETVDIAFGTITNTGLTGAGGVSGTDSLAEFNISDPLPGAGVTVSTGSLALTELGAANAMEKAYTLVLDTDPGADVTITVTNGDGTAVEVDTDSGTSGNQSALTFTAGGDGSGSGAANGNWAVAQTVTVRALNDGDAANESFNLTHSAAVSDTGNPYHDITIDPVVVTITDAGHGIIVSKSMLSVAENDETATYTAALKSQPSGNVVISATSGATATAEVDTDAGMAGNQNTLTFTNADWKTPQTVTVTGKGAGSTSITHAVASSADTAGYPADGSLSLDSVSVEVTRGPINLEIQVTDAYEGEDIVVTLKLSRALGGSSTAAQRRFQVSSFAPNAAAMTYCKNNAICDSTDAAAVAADFTVRNQVGVTFGPNETTQTFRFATATDNTVEPREVAGVVIRQYVGSGGLIATSSGRDRSLRAPVIASGLTQIYSHGFIDDGARPVAGLTLTETSGGTEVSEDGTTLTDTYDIALNTEPTHDVTVTATAGAGAQVAAGGAAASTATLTFTSGNWNMAQAITVTGVDDNIDNAGGARTVAISHAATSTDTDYRIDPAGSVGVTVTDDDATTVTLARAGSGGIAEDGGTEDITITLGRALVAGESVTVPLAVTGATAATHYTIGLKGSGGTGVTIDTSNPHSAGNPAVILAGAGAQVATLILTAVDTSDTNRRTVDIAFGTNSRAPSHTGLSGGIRTAGSASVPINDDDAVVTVADASAAEGGAVVFTVSLPENAPSGGVTVGYSTANGRGESTDAAYQVATGDDYTAAAQNAAITIAAGAGTGTISIATRQDTTYEGDHHFTLTLDSTSFFNIDATANSAIGTITDAADTPSFEFSATSSAVAESVGTLSLTVEKTGTTLVPATVTYETVDDTATGGSDFTAIAATDLVFAAGDTGKTVTVTITDDSNDELSETFSVDLAAKAHARLGTDAIHDVTITDNDPTPVTLSATNTAIAEDGGAKTITVRLGRALTGSETLSVALTFSGDATFGTDYTLAGPETAPTGVTYSNLASTDLAMNPPTIAFSGAANAASSATLTLTAGDDATDEGASESVSLGLGTLTAANLDGGASGSGAPTFDITDDDDAPGSIRLSTDVTSIAEDAATATVTVTATVTGDSAYNTATTVAVEVGDAGDSATEGIDYANVAGFDITIAAGAMSGQGNFSLDPTDDSLDEDNESIRVKGTSGSLGITGTSISLTDDDDPPEISVDAPSVDEGASGANATLRFTVSLDAASGREVTVAYAETTGGTATQDTDYAALAGDTLTFDAGETSKHIDITVTGDDIDEDNETVKVQLSSPGNATLFGGKATLDATGTITDDDDAPTVSVANATAVTEGNDPKTTVDMRFAVTLSAASSRTVTVPYTLGGSATKDDDYTAPNPTSLTISAGSTSADIVVPVKGDELDEANETITVALGTPTNATISTTQGAGTATGTITDDESTPTATLILTPASIAESGASNVSTVTASLSGASDQAVTLAVAAAAVSPARASDFALSSDTTLTIAAGSRSSTGTVTITAVDNNVDAANKSVTVSATASGGRGVANPASATLTITDDDDAPTGIALSVDPTSVAEDAGTTAIQVTASTTGSATYSTARTLAVTVGGGASTATSGTDHTAVTGFSMVLPAGTSSVAQSFNLEPLDDRVDEDSETIQVAGTTIGATISPATITLTDNDTKGVTVTGSSLTVLEADDTGTGSTREDQATYTVVLDSQPTADVTITISAGSAVTVSPTSLTFTPSGAGIWSTAQTVTVTAVDDDIDNSGDARSAGITHTVAAGSSDYGGVTADGVRVTVTDDDAAPTGITLTTDTASIAEDAATKDVKVTATVNGDTTYATATTVRITVGANGDSAVEGADYAEVAAFDLTIAAGAMRGQGSFSLDPTDDALDEDSESISVEGTSGNLGITGTSIGLTDDDGPPVLSIDAPRVTEGASGANATLRFRVTLTPASGKTVTVAYAEATGGTATQGTDYTTLPSGTLTFDAGETEKHIDITVTGDAVDEDDETVKVRLSSPANAMLAGGNATLDGTGTLTDDDTAGARLSVGGRAVEALDVEKDETTVIEVRLNSRPVADVTVTLTSSDDAIVQLSADSRGESVDLTFEPDDWDDPQRVTVHGLEDGAVTVTTTVSSTDPQYGSRSPGLVPPPLTIRVVGVPIIHVTPGRSLIREGEAVTFTLAATKDGAPVAVKTTVPVRVDVGYGCCLGDGEVLAEGEAGVRTVTIAQGQTTATFEVRTVDDDVDVLNEIVVARIVKSAAYRIGGGYAAVQVGDDDFPPAPDIEVSVAAPASVMEGGVLAFTLTASEAPESDLAVMLTLYAHSFFPYVPGPGVRTVQDVPDEERREVEVTLPAGQTEKVFEVTLDDDSRRQGHGTMVVYVGFSPDYRYARADHPGNRAQVALVDDETRAEESAISVADAEVREGPGAALEFVVTLARKAGTDRKLWAHWRVRDGTATAGEDYGAGVATGMVLFRPGETELRVRIPVFEDARDEGDGETVVLELHGASPGAFVERGEAVGTIRDAAGVGSSTADQVQEAVAGPRATACIPASVLDNVADYVEETQHGQAHVARWQRVLAAFGDGNGHAPMTVAEARTYVARGWRRWESVAAALECKETAAAWWAALGGEARVRALYGETLAPVAQVEREAGVAAHYTGLAPEVRVLAARSAVGLRGAGTHASLAAWWDGLDCRRRRVAVGAGSVADAASPWCRAWSALGDTHRAEALRIGRALLGANLPEGASRDAGAAGRLEAADAQVVEAPGAVLAFVVRLTGASDGRTGAVTVAYATRDGTAMAGADYTAVAGTLAFAPGESEKTVAVSVHDDGHDEGEETMMLVLSAPEGATLGRAEATGTIANTDAMPSAWLARLGRTVAEQVVEGVSGRFGAERGAGFEGRLAGQTLGGGSPPAEDTPPPRGDVRPGAWPEAEAEDPVADERKVTFAELLTGSDFTWTGAPDDAGGSWALWARAVQTRFDGADGSLGLDGEVATGFFGMDFARDDWLLGTALTHSEAEGSYTLAGGTGGAVASSLTALAPYAHLRIDASRTAFGVLGVGRGTLTLTPEGETGVSADLGWQMAAAGLNDTLVRVPVGGGFGLSAKTDALWVRTTSGAVPGLAEADAQVTRLRLGLEGSWTFALDAGASLVPSLETGLRHDAGDAETGWGLEFSAGVAWSDSAHGLDLSVESRRLATHADGGFGERGYAASLRFDPAPDTERGFSLTIEQDGGAATSGGVEALFGQGPFAADETASTAGGRLSAEAAYGLPVRGGRSTGTPYLTRQWSEGARDTTLGWRLTPDGGREGAGFTLDLKATRREGVGSDESGIGLDATLRW